MIERRPFLQAAAHGVLILGVLTVAFPVWLAIVASTHPQSAFQTGLIPVWPGTEAAHNYGMMLGEGISNLGAPPLSGMLWNSLVMALVIATGKIAISITSAFAIVYFRFPFRMLAFWAIFITLMLPVEVLPSPPPYPLITF